MTDAVYLYIWSLRSLSSGHDCLSFASHSSVFNFNLHLFGHIYHNALRCSVQRTLLTSALLPNVVVRVINKEEFDASLIFTLLYVIKGNLPTEAGASKLLSKVYNNPFFELRNHTTNSSRRYVLFVSFFGITKFRFVFFSYLIIFQYGDSTFAMLFF